MTTFLRMALMIPISISAISAFAVDQFNVHEMPAGAEVTLPGAARTMVPIATKIRLSSTDAPQTISIVPVVQGGAKPSPIRLTIFDSKQERVKYVQVAPGAPFLYSFKGLSAITIQTDLPGGTSSTQNLMLQVESDKPLTVAR